MPEQTSRRRPRFRWLHRLYARLGGYFWVPCPLCGVYFGGHELRDRPGLSSTIPHPSGQPGRGKGICPACTLAGRGVWTSVASEIRSGRRVDPDLWYNPQTGVVEVRPGTAEERRAAARAEGWRPGGE